MLFPLRVIRRIHREGFRCIPEAIRFRIALHRQRPFLQTETALRQAEEDGYQAFIRRHEAPLSAPFTPTMRLSFLIPTYNTPPELLRALADSLLHQSCGAWEACFYDGASTRADTRELLQALTQEDNRFRVTFGAENRGIAGNTNAALTMATGKFVALCDHDDLLAPDAVRCILEAAQDGADFVYTDEDKVSADGMHFFEPHLKPDFAPDSLRSGNYICRYNCRNAANPARNQASSAVQRSACHRRTPCPHRYKRSPHRPALLRGCSEPRPARASHRGHRARQISPSPSSARRLCCPQCRDSPRRTSHGSDCPPASALAAVHACPRGYLRRHRNRLPTLRTTDAAANPPARAAAPAAYYKSE